MSIYDCPHCGEKTFTPLTKALAGPKCGAPVLSHRACKACGRKCVNGQVSAVIRMLLSLLMGAGVLASILFVEDTVTAMLCIVGAVLLYVLLNGLINAFFFPLIKAVRRDA